MQDLIDNLKEFFSQATADMALKVLGAIAMLLLGLFIIKRVMRLFERSTRNSKLDKSLISFLQSLITILLRTVLIIIVLTYLGVPNTSFIAVLSSAGLAIGLALQGSLGNFAGGLMLLIFHPFRVGDYIKLDSVEGTVVGMNVMYTQLSTFDKKKVVVPNATLSNGVLTNFSAYESRRVDIPFTIDYEADVEQVKALMMDQAKAHPLVLETPAPDARLGAFSGGLPVYTLRCWCKTGDFWAVTFDLTEGLKQAFDRAGISVPPPQAEHIIRQAE